MTFIQRQENKTQVHHETIYVVSSVLYPSAIFLYKFFFNKTREISTKNKKKRTTVKKFQFKNCAVRCFFYINLGQDQTNSSQWWYSHRYCINALKNKDNKPNTPRIYIENKINCVRHFTPSSLFSSPLCSILCVCVCIHLMFCLIFNANFIISFSPPSFLSLSF